MMGGEPGFVNRYVAMRPKVAERSQVDPDALRYMTTGKTKARKRLQPAAKPP